jgi:putative oxidoreductase
MFGLPPIDCCGQAAGFTTAGFGGRVELRVSSFDPGNACASLLIRVSVGLVFLSEGIQKVFFSDALGVGRFTKIGIPAPEVMAPFVGVVEIGCGALVLVGLMTRLAALPLIVDMLVAIASAKVPILVQRGFWRMAHEARTDFAMLLGALFLLIAGAGSWSIDAHIAPRRSVP